MTMGTATGDYEHALGLYDAGDFQACRELALRGLAEQPKDVNLLRLAGKSSIELDLPDGTTYLEQAVELDPDNADAWRELGDALLYDGRMREATDAFRKTLELRPDDSSSLVDLAHAAYAAGAPDEAISHVQRAIERDPQSLPARRAMIDIYRAERRLDEALAAAEALAASEPDDALAALDVAELNLVLDRPVDAASAFARLRQIEDDPEHETYAYHGMIEAEFQRERWRRALDLSIEATRFDRYGRTTDVLAYAVAQVFGAADRPAPTREEIDAALAASRAEHRRLHEESLVF